MYSQIFLNAHRKYPMQKLHFTNTVVNIGFALLRKYVLFIKCTLSQLTPELVSKLWQYCKLYQ